MTQREEVKVRVDMVFRQFRRVFVPEAEVGRGEMKQGGRFFLALDPLSPVQSLRNPRIGRYVLVRSERRTRRDDSRLCTQLWVSNVLAGFYALAVLDGRAARIAWARFAAGASIRDCAAEVGCSYWMARGYLTGERAPDLYMWWNERFSRIAPPGNDYAEPGPAEEGNSEYSYEVAESD